MRHEGRNGLAFPCKAATSAVRAKAFGQRDRLEIYETEGHRFESCRARSSGLRRNRLTCVLKASASRGGRRKRLMAARAWGDYRADYRAPSDLGSEPGLISASESDALRVESGTSWGILEMMSQENVEVARAS